MAWPPFSSLHLCQLCSLPAINISRQRNATRQKLHDVHSHIRSWPGNPASALLLLTWGAVALLLEPHVSLGESVAEEMQGRAQEAGLFRSAAASLEACQGLMSTAVAQLCRGVALKALCVSATAFELGPSRQDPGGFSSLVQLIKLVVADDVLVCNEVWDEGRELLAPIRAVLLDACTLFPAHPRPYLQLLGAFAHGSLAASAAYTHLQVRFR
ncbi:hypothetical protein DUNSADRAFT_1102 [Dunaliella salina]|uniref:Uncharacterized protein n=1 Tax=Dunaliella salina TaxID=3046 RepID=A0ABQ7GXI8_DUNSA|nr:hypothetical protein DUNSADRAFT_1102 [Dunaliella salina]|eukprot:KAF5839325.1 hypothetical protein DUNSADRAFT_1102 [Dunaliella salina]